MTVSSLLDSRLVMVTGKGGTGKSTFAASLGAVAAAKGKRTVVCEIDAQQSYLAPLFGQEIGYDLTKVNSKLSVCNITWDEALSTYLQRALKLPRLVRMTLDNRVVSRMLDITPGARETVILSRVDDLVQSYDLVIVDMPASGHTFSLLDVLRSLLRLFRGGPIRARAEELYDRVRRDDTKMAFVALPEEMVINETLETAVKLRDANLLGGLPSVFLNRATVPSLTEEERQLILSLSKEDLDPVGAEYVRAGIWEDRLEQATLHSTARLSEVFTNAPVLVPPVSSKGSTPIEVMRKVAIHLGRQVGLTRRDFVWN